MRTRPVSLKEGQHLALGTPPAGLRVGISHCSMVDHNRRWEDGLVPGEGGQSTRGAGVGMGLIFQPSHKLLSHHGPLDV